MKVLKHFFCVIVVSSAGPVLANDDGLYEDVFDPNSSFVRILAPGETFVAVNDTTIRDIDDGVSDYVNVMPGEVSITSSDATTLLEVAPNSHYTIVMLEGQEPEILTDAITLDPAKSDVTFYNLSGVDDVELFVPAADQTAISDIDAMSGSSVALRAPLTLDFQVRANGETLASVEQVKLVRRSGVSIILTEAGGDYAAIATSNMYLK
ncbi:alginate O-acetyltransferase AlgF [Yoonia sp. 2307UL14-13]|uniref:alginate O-acetyltransferase AlgF n=1 Tax=Yoonia sp. 2307UL14-13 TaxID=3126506 RepID=UPI0030AA38EC